MTPTWAYKVAGRVVSDFLWPLHKEVQCKQQGFKSRVYRWWNWLRSSTCCQPSVYDLTWCEHPWWDAVRKPCWLLSYGARSRLVYVPQPRKRPRDKIIPNNRNYRRLHDVFSLRTRHRFDVGTRRVKLVTGLRCYFGPWFPTRSFSGLAVMRAALV